MAAVVLHGHADDAAGRIGLPVLALGGLLLRLGQVIPPAQLLQQHVVELGIAGREVGALGVRAVGSQQRDALALDAEVGAEVAAAIHDVLAGVVEVGRARVLQLWRAVARPRQAEVVAVELVPGLLVDAALRAQRLHVEDVHVAHVRLEPLRALAGVADGPDAGVDFAEDRSSTSGSSMPLLALDHLVVLHQLVGEAELLARTDT